MAIFDVAIEYQCGRANIKTTSLNILKGFFACSLLGVVPVELYKFCITLQNSLAHDIAVITASEQVDDFGGNCSKILADSFSGGLTGFGTLFAILSLLLLSGFADKDKLSKFSPHLIALETVLDRLTAVVFAWTSFEEKEKRLFHARPSRKGCISAEISSA